jgi:hypothetical protein
MNEISQRQVSLTLEKKTNGCASQASSWIGTALHG